jgi:hypothetical protein
VAGPPAPLSPSSLRIVALLIDAKHRTWAIGTAVAAAVCVAIRWRLAESSPTAVTGGTRAGLIFGVLGSLLMLLAGALSAHRRLAAIRWLPMRRWIGQRQTWLRGHIWLGLLSVVVILCHSGWHLGGPLEIALWIALAITILSGVLGLAFQGVVPRMLTNRIGEEAPYEQIPHLCDGMRRQADDLFEQARGATGEGPVKQDLEALAEGVRPFLQSRYDRSSPLADAIRAEALFHRFRQLGGMDAQADILARLAALCDERRQLGEQERLHGWLHLWLLVHVPITVVLLVLGIVHAVTAVYW